MHLDPANHSPRHAEMAVWQDPPPRRKLSPLVGYTVVLLISAVMWAAIIATYFGITRI